MALHVSTDRRRPPGATRSGRRSHRGSSWQQCPFVVGTAAHGPAKRPADRCAKRARTGPMPGRPKGETLNGGGRVGANRKAIRDQMRRYATEREGFEPSEARRLHRFSKPARSAAPAPLPVDPPHRAQHRNTTSRGVDGPAGLRAAWQHEKPSRNTEAPRGIRGFDPGATPVTR